jgi:hypothetical protein
LVENGTHDYAAGYGDYLQAPLQPLMDDLGSATYDVFERDPVKYRQYEEVSEIRYAVVRSPGCSSDGPANGLNDEIVLEDRRR